MYAVHLFSKVTKNRKRQTLRAVDCFVEIFHHRCRHPSVRLSDTRRLHALCMAWHGHVGVILAATVKHRYLFALCIFRGHNSRVVALEEAFVVGDVAMLCSLRARGGSAQLMISYILPVKGNLEISSQQEGLGLGFVKFLPHYCGLQICICTQSVPSTYS